MQKTLLTIVLATLCLNFNANAQGRNNIIKPLSIGDTISEVIWKIPLQVINERAGKKTITLNDYRNKKLIILDFWATWCSSCINAFPKLDSLSTSTVDVKILLVNAKRTRDTKAKIDAVFKRITTTKATLFSVPTIANDTVFDKLFPHNILPHYVWIYQGKILASTDSYEVTGKNIAAVLKDPAHSFVVKSDRISFDYRKSFRTNLGKEADSAMLTTSMIMRYLPGLVSSKNNYEDGNRKRYYFINRPLISLYQFAFNCSPNRILVDTKDGRQFPYQNKNVKSDEMGDWRKNNLFSYELIIPNTEPEDRVCAKMLSDLNLYFQLDGKKEQRVVDCYVLSRSNNITLLPHAGEAKAIRLNKRQDSLVVTNTTVKELTDYLNYYPSFKDTMPIVVDETNYPTPVDMLLSSAGMDDINSLNTSLKRYGFTLIRQKRTIEMCVITN
ncbi:thiol-disulfide isomerase/thioredoxin [Mucilaginibacter gracilis]|uniref:Thiol-disulfide isomerase/thioredoxin n=1 Tax=Mucilaginibacter gracilis TaxID=423350 RepID=A0A495J3J6_9SPHI|nr:thioredoxin domain-containing protein [Mucilaginibacter gracilis]RKR83517.1 thiol-disulfide isomerase/thioredoxin [Mucilaginibacter gracilis]